MIEYSWKDGSRLSQHDAQTIGEYLEKLRIQKGELTPQEYVKDARKKNSPLHETLTWNDKEAAQEHRLDQARYVLRSVSIKIIRADEERQVRAFVRTKKAEYVPVRVAMANTDMRAQILAQALKIFEELRECYKDYEELAEIFAAIDTATKKHNRRKKKAA